MKLVLTIIAAVVVVGISAAPLDQDLTKLNQLDVLNLLDTFNGNNSGLTPLDRDFIDFLKLIPEDKVREIGEKYVNDSEIRHAIRFVFSEDFHNLVYAVEDLPEHHKLVQILEESGFSAIRNIKIIHKILGMKDYVPPPLQEWAKELEKAERGLSGLIKEYIEILPVEKIKELHKRKLAESRAFAKFISYIKSTRFAKILADLRATKEAQNLLKVSLENGIDFLLIGELNARIIGVLPK